MLRIRLVSSTRQTSVSKSMPAALAAIGTRLCPVMPGTVFASMPLRVGDQYDDEKGAAAIRSLFALGLFKDVRLETQGDVLVVVVEERPTETTNALLDFFGP